MNLAPYLKAIVGALIAGLGVIGASLADDNAITAQDWVSAAIAALVVLGGIYSVPNQVPPEPDA